MMINKRLIGICKDSKKYMILTVIANMISIICNILIVILIGGFINSLYLGEKFANDLTMIKAMKDFKITDNISLFNGVICIAILLIIRYSSNILYGKFSHLASANARVT
ncbi:cysteine ABC transporter ATP-binding protein, partial [Clostridium neonatale]|nr:cysteine ABC transporter ATP-binding protein [Clostridium neonatale]